jgi:hypothetical protein
MQRGFIQLIVIVALLIIVISLLGVNLKDVAGNPLVKGNFSYVYNFSTWLWDNYLHDPVRIAFRVWVDVLWKPFVGAMDNIGKGKSPAPFMQ